MLGANVQNAFNTRLADIEQALVFFVEDLPLHALLKVHDWYPVLALLFSFIINKSQALELHYHAYQVYLYDLWVLATRDGLVLSENSLAIDCVEVAAFARWDHAVNEV